MFQGKRFLKIADFSKSELEYLIDFSIHLKKLKKKRIPHEYLKNQNICLLFEKSSTRTRAAFTVAANDLGANSEFLGINDIQLGKKESVEDTAKVLGSMFDGIEYRGFNQETVEELAEYSGVPVWNGLTNEWHPTQMIADFMTIKEKYGKLAGLSLVYVGDGRNNMANSLLITAAVLGIDIRIASPKALFPDQSIVDQAKSIAEQSGSRVSITENVKEAVIGADVIYTDVWVSMGEEEQFKERINLLKTYQLNKELVSHVGKDFIFLHCLPAFHDSKTDYGKMISDKYGIKEMEVTDEVFRSKYSKQFEQAENRMHSIKAIMAATNGHLFMPEIGKETFH